MKNFCYMNSPIGVLEIVENGQAITGISFGNSGQREERTALLEEAVRQLEEYFGGRRKEFDLPLDPVGTAFQKQVWEELKKIPYGETRSYGQLAKAIGNPKACRAVGMANHRNPIPIIVPCHRVIGADGTLTGYAGGLAIKRILLELEDIL